MNKTFKHGMIDTQTAGADLAYTCRFVKVASGAVVYAGDKELAIGVPALEANSGEDVGVVVTGIVLVEVGTGGVTENTTVTSDASGKAVAWTTGAVNGIALETAAAGEYVRVLLR